MDISEDKIKYMYDQSLSICYNNKSLCENIFRDYNDLSNFMNNHEDARLTHLLRFVSIRMPRLRKYYKRLCKFINKIDTYSKHDAIETAVEIVMEYTENYYKIIYAMYMYHTIRECQDKNSIIMTYYMYPASLYLSNTFKEVIIDDMEG